MATLKVREIVNSLGKKGFVQSQGDHAYLIFYCNGKKTSIRTKVSHGSNEINDSLINLMSIQVKLEKKKFVDMVNCPFTLEDYLKELTMQGYEFK
jgi:predicted RNA binding protein YcfA (HicA-like mRNA interferase family)